MIGLIAVEIEKVRTTRFWIGLLLLHSLVDYPLRTSAIATVTGALLAILFATRRSRDPDAALASAAGP